MINKLFFDKVNNFWIDNGIVGLYKVLQDNEVFDNQGNKIDFEINLKPDGLEICLNNSKSVEKDDELHSDLILVLNEAKNEVVKKYLKATGAGWIFKNGNFEVYRKTDFRMHLKSFFTGKTPKTEGGLCSLYDKKEITDILSEHQISFIQDKENIVLSGRKYKNNDKKEVTIPNVKREDIKANDRLMTKNEFISFLDFIENNSPVVIDSKPISLIGRGFLNTPPQYEIGDYFKSDFLKEGKKLCGFSGKSYQLADVTTGMDYPFLTGKSGEMNFASQLERKPSISAKYAFIALFSFYNLHYQLQGDLKNYFVFYDSNLKELNSFYDAIQPNIAQLKNEDYCNFETYIIGTEYENETLFGFIVSVYKQVKQKLAKDKRKEVYTKSIFTFSDDGNIFRDVKEYTSLAQLFELFDAFDDLDDEKFNFEFFLNMIRFFSKTYQSQGKPKYDTTWRNRLCADILNFRSIAKTVEWFLGEVRLKEEIPQSIMYLDKIFQVYNAKTQFDMKPEMVEMCKSIGNRIGRHCREKEDKGILFSIRNAKNRTEFLTVLAETQFRTEVSYSEDFFKNLPDTPQWEEYKALVSIFAMNSFLYDPTKTQTS
jgi:hypothetical protein